MNFLVTIISTLVLFINLLFAVVIIYLTLNISKDISSIVTAKITATKYSPLTI